MGSHAWQELLAGDANDSFSFLHLQHMLMGAHVLYSNFRQSQSTNLNSDSS